MAERTPNDDLIFDLGYGLKRAGVRLPIEACRQLGARVLAHLKLARWEFSRRPPEHQFQNDRADGQARWFAR